MHRPVRFMTLPVELICCILSFLDSLELIHCSFLSKRLRKVILESSRLQYTIELAKHRMVSLLPPSAAPPYISRLKILRDRERAWKTFRWNGQYNLKLPPTGSVYEFVGGLYGNGKEDDRRVTASISFLELPTEDSASRESVGTLDLKTWTHSMSDVIIIDFTMDPSRDLLVLIALAAPGSKYVYDLHLRSLSTNEPHPKAALPILPCLIKPTHTQQSSEHTAAVRVQVSGNLVALLIKEVHDSVGAHLEIWDWLNNPQVSCKMARISGIDDFTFLSKDTFLLVRPTGNFEVYTFQNPIITGAPPICQASYAFPPLSDGYMYWYITMSSNPAPGSIPRTAPDGNAADGTGKPTYYPKPDERIHACCVYIFNPSIEDTEHRVHCFVFFVNIRSLLHPPAEWLQKAKPRYYTGRSKKPHSSSSLDTDFSETGSQQVPLQIATPNTSSSSSSTSAFTPPPFINPHPEYLYFPIAPPTVPASSSSTTPTPISPTPIFHFPLSLPLRPPPPSSPAARTPAHIPWAVWGPQSTRWFQECLNTDWQHSIYGLRTIESVTRDKLVSARARACVPRYDPYAASVATAADDAPRAAAAPAPAPGTPAVGSQHGVEAAHAVGDHVELPIPRRHLRLRDYNPYSVMEQLQVESHQGDESESMDSDKKGKGKLGWRTPHVVTEPSTTNVRGVFRHDVTSWLPYVEVVSEEVFEVTDVMMDDCRLLLLKRGENGRLKRVDVLTM